MQDQSLYPHINNPTFPEQEHLKCPRCDSPNTKFCYYNNYNLSQPRYYCKNCKRYWTKGGSLRNIPVGGGSRKNSRRSSTSKKSSSSSPSSTTTASASPTVPSASSVVPSVSSSNTPKAALNKDLRIFSALLGPGQSGNLDNGLGPDRPNLQNLGSASGSGSDDIRMVDQEVENVEKNNSATSSCWNSGSDWPDLAIFTPGSKSQ